MFFNVKVGFFARANYTSCSWSLQFAPIVQILNFTQLVFLKLDNLFRKIVYLACIHADFTLITSFQCHILVFLHREFGVIGFNGSTQLSNLLKEELYLIGMCKFKILHLFFSQFTKLILYLVILILPWLFTLVQLLF